MLKPEENLILIVDDNSANLRLLTHVLESEGYSCIQATNGSEAIEKANKHIPDLILLDIMMPDMDGFEVINKIKGKERTGDVPIIFLSSLSQTDDKVKGFKSGGVDYITKPFHKEETLARINTHLKIRSLQKALNERIDILRKRELELSRLNKEKDDLVRMVSHDIKNPLSGIIGLVKLIRNDEVSTKNQNKMLKVIEQSGNNLLKMVMDMLDREAKNIEHEDINIQEIKLCTLIERVIDINMAKAVMKNIELKYSVEPNNLEISVDETKIETIINNLISNALKFTPSNGRVCVHAKLVENDKVLIKVEDTGIGIPEELTKNLFDNSEKTSRLGTGGETGTGLGLDIVKLYVDMHNGKIWVDSKINHGTKFYIQIPLSEN